MQRAPKKPAAPAAEATQRQAADANARVRAHKEAERLSYEPIVFVEVPGGHPRPCRAKAKGLYESIYRW
jgi:hypothetical protein